MSERRTAPHGVMYWITGLAGVGKTTIGTALHERIKTFNQAVVMLDGDALREVFGNDLGYTAEDRYKCAMRYARLSKYLCDQGITVICCTISMFEKVRQWSRNNVSKYIEVYVKASDKTLEERDKKNLYSGGYSNVAGINQPVEVPVSPHITLNNDGDAEVASFVESILLLEPETGDDFCLENSSRIRK